MSALRKSRAVALICRIGSLENKVRWMRLVDRLICRIGSLEIEGKANSPTACPYLPHRQLRNIESLQFSSGLDLSAA